MSKTTKPNYAATLTYGNTKYVDKNMYMTDNENNEVLEDGIRISGGEFKKQTNSIRSHHDHRISMAFAIASVRSKFDIEIEGVDNVKTSFPNFIELANSIGMKITQTG